MDDRTRRRGRWMLATGLAVALALVAAACRTTDDARSTDVTSSTVAKDGGLLVMAVDQETDGWNPSVSQWTNAAYWVGSSVLEPLATYDEHGETVMWLAESIAPTTEGSFDSWRIKVKPNITFHNGEKLDASVVKANLDLLLNGKSLAGIALDGRLKAVTEIDALTVQVDITVPWADFPALMTNSMGMMMAKEMLAEPLGGIAHPIGTGPFVFTSWAPHEAFKARKNTNYWRPGEPHLDAIEFRPIVDNKKALTALQNGDVDVVVTTKAGDIALAGPGTATQTDFRSEKTFILANTIETPTLGPNPLTNVHARRAVAHATDRAAIRAQVGGDQTLETSTQFMVAGTPWAVPDDQTGYYDHDLGKAKQEIEAYQRETGSATIEFELATTNAPDDLAIAQALSEQWRAVGITANVRSKDTLSMVSDSVFGKYQAIIQRNYGYPNPDTDLIFFSTATAKGPGALSVNFSQYTNPGIDDATRTIQATTDRAVQREAYLSATRLVNEGAANQWLYDTPYAVIRSEDIHGTESLDTHSFGNALPKPWLWGNVWRQ